MVHFILRLWLLQNADRKSHARSPTRYAATCVGRNGNKPSPALLQEHSLGGCTIDMRHQTVFGGIYRFDTRYLVSIPLAGSAVLSEVFLNNSQDGDVGEVSH